MDGGRRMHQQRGSQDLKHGLAHSGHQCPPTPGVLGVPTSLALVVLTRLGHLRLILLSQNLPSTRRPPQMS